MAEKEKFTLVLFSGDLDKALAAFILATTAASMGMEVTMFFTFWGLNVIKRNKGSIKSQGWMRQMLNVMNRGGSSRLKLSRFNMLGLGTWMMKKLMKQSNILPLMSLLRWPKKWVSKWYPAPPLAESWGYRMTLSAMEL